MFDSLINFNIGSIIAGIFSVLFAIAAIVGGILLHCTLFSKANEGKLTGFMGKLYDFVNFRKFSVEPLIKVTYLILAIYTTLDAFMSFRGGFWSGTSNLLLKLVVYNAVLRIVYELAMLLVRGLKNLNEINAKLDGDAKNVNSEFEDVLFDESKRTPKPAPQPAQSAPQPVQSVPQPVQSVPQPVQTVPQPVQTVPQPVQSVPQPVQSVPQPVQPVPQPVQSVPQPVQPVPQPVQPVPQPVQSVPSEPPVPPVPPVPPEPPVPPVPPVPPEPPVPPVPQPVSVAAAADSVSVEDKVPEETPAPVGAESSPSLCKNCGKEIKSGARFCPFCGSSQQ